MELTNLDAVDIDGAVQIDAGVTVGVDDTGYDVKSLEIQQVLICYGMLQQMI